jgi:hypothetical protein
MKFRALAILTTQNRKAIAITNVLLALVAFLSIPGLVQLFPSAIGPWIAIIIAGLNILVKLVADWPDA